MAITRKTQIALRKYGVATCLKALRMNETEGLGANTIGNELDLTTRQADSAIDAGREYKARCTTPVSRIICDRCGGFKPSDRSCDCFDNNCQ